MVFFIENPLFSCLNGQKTFAWCVGLMIYQFGGLIAGEIAFGPFTALAVVVAAGMLYLLFRPAAKPKGAGRLEAASKNA